MVTPTVCQRSLWGGYSTIEHRESKEVPESYQVPRAQEPLLVQAFETAAPAPAVAPTHIWSD